MKKTAIGTLQEKYRAKLLDIEKGLATTKIDNTEEIAILACKTVIEDILQDLEDINPLEVAQIKSAYNTGCLDTNPNVIGKKHKDATDYYRNTYKNI